MFPSRNGLRPSSEVPESSLVPHLYPPASMYSFSLLPASQRLPALGLTQAWHPGQILSKLAFSLLLPVKLPLSHLPNRRTDIYVIKLTYTNTWKPKLLVYYTSYCEKFWFLEEELYTSSKQESLLQLRLFSICSPALSNYALRKLLLYLSYLHWPLDAFVTFKSPWRQK